MPTQSLQNSLLQPLTTNLMTASGCLCWVQTCLSFRNFQQVIFGDREFEAKENKNRAGFREKLELKCLHTLHATWLCTWQSWMS